MTTVIALIPARSGSKGVSNKNTRLLGGHPLIEWSIRAAKKAGLIDRVLVSTDSREYADLSIRLGAEAPFLRPEEISGDSATDYDFVVHALNWLKINGGEPDYIVHLRPTTPFRDPNVIDDAIRTYRIAGKATALRSVHEMSESAYKTFEISADGRLKRVGTDSMVLDSANNPRQQFPATYQANGYVDVLSTQFVNANRLIHGDWVLPFVTPAVVEVDTEDDFAHLEYQLARSSSIAAQLFG